MANKTYAKEWLLFSKKNLDTAKLLLLRMATNYYKEYRYPNPNYSVPSRKEIEEVL